MNKYQDAMQKYEPTWTPKDEDYQIGIVMLAGVDRRTTSISKLAKATRLGWVEVSDVLDKCRDTGLIRDDKWRPSNWSDDETGGVAFGLDLCVVRGWMQRAT